MHIPINHHTQREDEEVEREGFEGTKKWLISALLLRLASPSPLYAGMVPTDLPTEER